LSHKTPDKIQSFGIYFGMSEAIRRFFSGFKIAGVAKQSQQVPDETQTHSEARGDLALRAVTTPVRLNYFRPNVLRISLQLKILDLKSKSMCWTFVEQNWLPYLYVTVFPIFSIRFFGVVQKYEDSRNCYARDRHSSALAIGGDSCFGQMDFLPGKPGTACRAFSL
jgi:hypothetical protein